MTFGDIPDNSTHNVYLLSEEDIKKLLQESTNNVILCTNRILVRINESQKVEIASTEEQQQDTSKILSHVVKLRKRYHMNKNKIKE